MSTHTSRFRTRRIKLERIRAAHDYAKNEWNIEYPFASLKLDTIGGHIIQRFEQEHPGQSLLVMDSYGTQGTLPGLVTKTLATFEYDSLELVLRWFPQGKNVPIVIDPRFNVGHPTIPDRRVRIETIYKRWKSAKQSIEFIADDLRLERQVVEEVLRYASDKVAA